MASTVKVANISPLVTPDILRRMFEFLGEVTELVMNASPHGDGFKEATIEYTTPEAAQTALHLSGTELGDRILLVTHARPHPLHLDPTKWDEMSRTVYVGNLAQTITQDEIATFFGSCGPVTFVKLAGDPTQATRYAFVEFATIEAAQAALAMRGSILGDRPVVVNHSKNPISKPVVKEDEGSAMRKVEEASRRQEAGAHDDDDDEMNGDEGVQGLEMAIDGIGITETDREEAIETWIGSQKGSGQGPRKGSIL
ncbi:hypothetical protein BZG36_03183 [Bifiguratus adelaidae]|uniref:RRM domain-containing protein n=1 Tax=Bifiguratus adelaidae TaxID=1938954 RepID=A0A261XYI3_9FUNG|nr:hypothetical protein BZG36_03183 [Bifiguratus adelaidae]